MNPMRPEKYASLLSLGRFLFWYVFAAAVLVFLLPWAGEMLQTRYEGMSATGRLFLAAGFFAVAGVWQLVIMRGYPRALRLRRRNDAARM